MSTKATTHTDRERWARIYREPLNQAFRCLLICEHAADLLYHFDSNHLVGDPVPREMIGLMTRPVLFLMGQLSSYHSQHNNGGYVRNPISEKSISWYRWFDNTKACHYFVSTPSFGSLPAVIDEFGNLVPVHFAREVTCGE